MSTRVVITGLGPICSIGENKDELWDSIVAGRTNVVRNRCSVDESLWEEFFVHKLDNFKSEKFIKNDGILKWIAEWKEGRRDIDFELLASVVGQAVEDSRLDLGGDRMDVGLFLVHENPGLENLIDSVADATYEAVSRNGHPPKAANQLEAKKMVYDKCARIGYDTQSFMHLFFVAKLFNIHGYSLFMNNACASGLFGLEAASQHIKSGRLNAAIVAGVDYPDYVYKYLWFKNLGMYAPDGIIRPFAKDRSGIVFGEGGAGIVLENYESAKRRGAQIYAEYAGGGFSLEASKVTLPNVASGLYAQTIAEALKDAGVRPEEVDLINPHGIGTGITDLHEANSISKVLGRSKTPVTAFKPYVGHNLGSSALLELCILLLSMKEGFIPPTLNCGEMDGQINLNLVRSGVEKTISTAMKLSCAFAGYNAAAVFRRPGNGK
ncbi:MAG: beta-ketoacyl synthase N-terminal-like domain-containing protein [Candidatus Omnitrophota bacterium]